MKQPQFTGRQSVFKLGYKPFLWFIFMGLFLWFALPSQAAPLTPTITQANGKNVVVGITTYINATINVPIKGNAEANKNIKIFDGAVQVGTGTSDGTGAYTVNVNLAVGNHSLTAVANDVSGDSPPSTIATVYVETTVPTFSTEPKIDNGYWAQDGYLAYSTGGTVVTDIADAGGSGLDFASCSVELLDLGPWNALYGTPLNVAGTLTNNGSNQLTYTITTPANIKTEQNKYQVKVTIKDKAGNTSIRTRYWYYDRTPPPAPTFKLYDPDHNVFTGTGEPATNVPDGSGYVNYYPNMTIVADQNIAAKRMKLTGNAGTGGGVYNAPPPDGFGVRYVNAYFNPSSGPGWGCSTFCGSSSIDYVTGNYTITMSTIAPQTTHSFYVLSYDTAGNQSTFTWFYLVFATAAPVPPGNPSMTVPPWDYNRLMGPGLEILSPYTIPVADGMAQTNSSNQSLCVFQMSPTQNWSTTDYRVCQVVKPSGQNYANTAGVYDDGDSWADLNGNFKWDAAEPFSDSSSTIASPSDGRTFKLANVRNLSFPLIDGTYMYLQAAIVAPTLLTSNYMWAGYTHYDSTTLTPALNSIVYSPDNTNLRTTTPSSVTALVYTYGEKDCDSSAHGVNTGAAFSSLSILNNVGTDVSTPRTTSWSYVTCTWTGSLYQISYNAVINTSTMALANGTYTVKAVVEDYMKQQLTDTTKTFKIDTVAPNPTNIFPTSSSTVSSIPSYTADIIDPPLADGTPGSGANMDLSIEQINPYKRIGLVATATATNTLTLNIDTPVGGEALDHRSTALPTGGGLPAGGAVQVWQNNAAKTIVGLTEGSLASNATITANAGGTISVSITAGALTVGQTYELYYLIPHFDSNDGVQKIAAVPTMPATAPGVYAARITGRDKVGNTQTTIPITSIQMDPPIGTITLTATPVNVYILSSPDATCTGVGSATPCSVIVSDIIKGASGTIVPDGTLVTISLSSAAGVIVQADANGIAADGFQVATAANGAVAGQIKFHVRSVNSTTFNTVTVSAAVGSATGAVDVYMLRPKVAISKAADVTTRNPGQVITYTITYTNSGNSVSNNTTIKDRLPNTVTYVAGSTKLNGVVQADGTVFNAGSGPSGEITVNAGSVAASGTGTVVYQATVK